MKKLIHTLKNIWAIDELKSKILVTLALVLTYRLGTQITLPGIDRIGLEKAIKVGLLPFIIPGIVKALFTASSINLLKRNIKWKK